MFFRRWWLLLALGILGALTKPKQSAWWLFPHAGGRIRSARRFGFARFDSAMAPVTVLQSSISDHLIWPWSFALSLDVHSN
jgi:hypothetical protein